MHPPRGGPTTGWCGQTSLATSNDRYDFHSGLAIQSTRFQGVRRGWSQIEVASNVVFLGGKPFSLLPLYVRIRSHVTEKVWYPDNKSHPERIRQCRPTRGFLRRRSKTVIADVCAARDYGQYKSGCPIRVPRDSQMNADDKRVWPLVRPRKSPRLTLSRRSPIGTARKTWRCRDHCS